MLSSTTISTAASLVVTVILIVVTITTLLLVVTLMLLSPVKRARIVMIPGSMVVVVMLLPMVVGMLIIIRHIIVVRHRNKVPVHVRIHRRGTGGRRCCCRIAIATIVVETVHRTKLSLLAVNAKVPKVLGARIIHVTVVDEGRRRCCTVGIERDGIVTAH